MSALDVSFRSTAPVLALVDAVFADPTAAAGRGRRRRDADALRRPRGPCRRGRAVAAGAAAATPRRRAVDACRSSNRGADLGAASAGGRAGATGSRAQTDGGVLLESKGRPLRAGRRAGAGAPARRFRPRPGARAEGARRAGGRAGPHGADRAAGGAGPAGAVRRAAAAAGRPVLRLRADQPARRTRRRRPDRDWRSGGAAAVGRAARPRPANGRTGARASAFFAALLAPRRLRHARTRCWPRRWARWAAARGCSRGSARRPPSRWTSCSTRR